MDKTEKEIVRDIVVYLEDEHIPFSVTNASANTHYHHGYNLAKGWFDITACLYDGKFLGIEVKTKRGKLSEEQIVLHERVRTSGGIVVVARGVADVAEAIYAEGL